MQCRWGIPFEQLVYIGDNIEKDITAPKQLGMKYLSFYNKDGLYVGDKDSFPGICSIDQMSQVYI